MLTDNEIKIKFEILSNKLKIGLFEDVINEAHILLKKREHQVFFNILSVAYQSIGKFEKSVEVMSKALNKNPNNPYFLNNMGTSQHKLHNLKEAEYYFQRGLEISPKYINILNNFGNLKRDLNRANDAIELYKRSLSVKEDVIETQINIAIAYESLGNFEKAKDHLNKVLAIDPKFTTADRMLSSLTKYTNESEHFNQMENKIKNHKLNDDQLSNLYFALGKANDDIKNYKKSFSFFKKGNDILKKTHKFDIQEEENNFSKIKKFFRNLSYEKKSFESKKFIFIVGMPRSGTSLIEQILSSHRSIFGGGELPFLVKIIEQQFLSVYDNISLDEIKNLDRLFQDCNKMYTDKILLLDDTKKIFTDKSPLNFKLIGFIKYIFPNAKIINCRRDPQDTLWSNFKNYFPNSLHFTNNLDDLVSYFNLYQDLMKFWKSIFKNDILDMNYEKLVNNPKEEILQLLKFCNVDWDDDCMKHENNSRSIKTASATQARKPIYKTALKSSDNYKIYLEKNISKIKS